MSARRPQRRYTSRRARGFILLPVVLALMLVAAVAFLLNRAGGMNMQMAAGGLQADSARYVAEAGLAQVNMQTQGRNCAGYTDLGTTAFGAHSFTATVNPKSGSPVTLASSAMLADGATSKLSRSKVTVRRTALFPLTLQPGTPGTDTSIRSASPNNNYGADATITVQGAQSIALVQFDLSSIPAGSIIRSAQLSLWHTGGGNDTTVARPVTKPWTEGTGVADSGATWNKYDGVRSWETAGGDYDLAGDVAITLPANNTWATWDLTAQTVAWHAGIQPNYGIALVSTGTGNNAFVSSDEPLNTTLRPRFDVTFLPPCGWVPAANGVTLWASKDTYIDEAHAGSNYGSDTMNLVSNAAKGKRGLLQFDLSSIPAGTVLQSATVRLFTGSVYPPAASTVTLNPVNVPWTEDGADWKTANGSSNSWKCGCFGGNFGAIAASANMSNAFTSGWVEWDVTALAQQWVASPGLNNGVGVLIDTATQIAFNTKDFTVNQPELVLRW